MSHWESIRTEYITTNISYRNLAVKRGVSFSALRTHAKDEGWRAARIAHRNNVVDQSVKIIAQQNAAENAERFLLVQQAADSMSAVIARVFEDADQFHRHLITTGLGMGETVTECRTMDKVDTKAIKDLTGALKDLSYVLRDVYDIPTRREQSAMDIAAERLLLDKRKADADTGADAETGVVEIAPVLADEVGDEE